MSPLTEPTRLTLTNNFTWNETVWNPSMISTSLWLDAADASTVTTVSGAVSQWNDKSGNGRHFTQTTSGNRPVYLTNLQNGRSGIVFSAASSHFLQGSGSFLSSAYCLMAVHKSDSTANQVIFSQRSTSLTAINPQISITAGNESQFIVRDNSGVSANSLITSHPTNAWTLHGGVRNENSAQVFINGLGGVAGSASFGLISLSAAAVGAAFPGSTTPGFFYSGGIAELIVCQIAERQRIEGYLAHKWGLTANLPSNHPYKTVGPTP